MKSNPQGLNTEGLTNPTLKNLYLSLGFTETFADNNRYIETPYL